MVSATEDTLARCRIDGLANTGVVITWHLNGDVPEADLTMYTYTNDGLKVNIICYLHPLHTSKCVSSGLIFKQSSIIVFIVRCIFFQNSEIIL